MVYVNTKLLISPSCISRLGALQWARGTPRSLWRNTTCPMLPAPSAPGHSSLEMKPVWLQVCDTSSGHYGLKARESAFFFIFSVFILPFELEYIGEFQSCFPPPPLFKYCNWFISTDMYTCFGGVLFHIGDDRVFGMFPCVTQWVLVTYFINNSVHMG